MKNMSAIYPGYNLYIKRDDCTGLASGGNKIRKLEYLVQDAIEKGYNTIITAGSQQSNHCRQTAAACALSGIKCHLLLDGVKPENYNGNLLLSDLLGAEIHFTGGQIKAHDITILEKELSSAGLNPYIIPYGGSNIIGVQGYIEAVRELKEQLDEADLKIDYIFFASGSGGTQAGLTLGKIIYNLQTELMPIGVNKTVMTGLELDETVFELVNQGISLFQINEKVTLSECRINNEYCKGGYGVVTENEIKAIRILAEKEGILLDPVYTGRAFHGMTDHLEMGVLRPGSNILFWHTGGLPANFYYADQLK